MMTRKDFFIVARELRIFLRRCNLTEEQKEEVKSLICDICQTQNALFDRRRFLNEVEKEAKELEK